MSGMVTIGIMAQSELVAAQIDAKQNEEMLSKVQVKPT